MAFDDRLRTVLGSPAEDAHDRAVRWRQLVELAARGGGGDAALVEQAISDIRADAPIVDEQVRMAAARAVASLELPIELVAAFAADRLSVAAPILAAARLTASDWGEVLACASEECRRFIRALRSEEVAPGVVAQIAEEPVEHSPIPSIGEVVARIERLRQSREPGSEAESTEPGATRLFQWECDDSGDIAWVEGAPRGPLIGRSIARHDEDGGLEPRVFHAFAERMPFHEATLELAEGTSVAGKWKISGSPAFDAATGRFSGYRGIAEREQVEAPPRSSPLDALPDADSLRELAHEIKTPLNAIIGFGEIISGQYLGPAHHSYRGRAAEIVAQARLLLTAIEDLDFAAKLRSASVGKGQTAHVGRLVEAVAPELRQLAETRGVELDASRTTRDLDVAGEPELVERLIFRMASAVIEQAEQGERLALSVDRTAEDCRVTISRPHALQDLTEAQLFGTGQDARGVFLLRLIRGLAGIAGADVVATPAAIALVFPRA